MGNLSDSHKYSAKGQGSIPNWSVGPIAHEGVKERKKNSCLLVTSAGKSSIACYLRRKASWPGHLLWMVYSPPHPTVPLAASFWFHLEHKMKNISDPWKCVWNSHLSLHKGRCTGHRQAFAYLCIISGCLPAVAAELRDSIKSKIRTIWLFTVKGVQPLA